MASPNTLAQVTKMPNVTIRVVQKDSKTPYIVYGRNKKKREDRMYKETFTRKQWQEMKNQVRREMRREQQAALAKKVPE